MGRISAAARALTTPLLPDDYLGLLNPLWRTAEPRGRVEAVRHEAPGAATIVIRPGRTWRGHRPGQWVPLGVDIDGVVHRRTFSLSSPPRADGRITVTVKAAPDGFVSSHLVHRIRPGAIVRLGAADGDFVLPPEPPRRLLFVTAGSGITPVMAMLRHLAERGALPDTVLVHSARTADEVIFGAELRRLAGLRLRERHTRAEGRFTPDDLPADWTERDAWACGPEGLLERLAELWRDAGVPERLRVERFRPAPAAGGGGAGGTVRFARSGVEVEADGTTALLDAGERAGALLPSGCRMGICHGCVGRLAAGRVRDLRTGRVHGDEGEIVQTCVNAAAGPVEIEL
ncbi:ferredoxin reductase [Actinomadura sp. WMMB 499]|uniref:ferredoxin reductase n=1 Tax=Actinomadura sp. WMMB 499 TaxID=1219491 RepID=UPI0012461380|nr:ferredoxin reductase [Actinomadura sp. WMMB 499]QFG27106.1 ferredoxin reductase [Actinomadura sp. WMMB 499]